MYKWWPSAAAVLLDGLLDRTHDTIESPASATTREALEEYLGRLIVLLRDTPAGALLRGLIAASVADSAVGLALVEDWLAPRRAAVVKLLAEGERRGEVRAGLDCDVVADLLFAPVYYRLMVEHAPLTNQLSTEIMAASWPGITATEDLTAQRNKE